jgi:hypothetical protein
MITNPFPSVPEKFDLSQVVLHKSDGIIMPLEAALSPYVTEIFDVAEKVIQETEDLQDIGSVRGSENVSKVVKSIHDNVMPLYRMQLH